MTLNVFYNNSRIKQYLKDGRAPRIETVINDPHDLRCNRRLENLPALQAKARAINDRLLETETVGQGEALVSPDIERITTPPPHGRAGRRPHHGSATFESKPWPAPRPTCCTRPPASPTSTFAS